jgi:pimeloyl-ACP methyl ester carboxylesterase
MLALVPAQIAQLVEQRIENPRVVGSIPTLGTTLLTGGKATIVRCGQVLAALFVVSSFLVGCSRQEPSNAEPTASSSAMADARDSRGALEGVLVTYQAGAEIGRERYRDDGTTLTSVIKLGPTEVTVTLPRGPGKVVVERGGKREERTLGPGEIALENGSWQAYALAANAFPNATDSQKVRVLLPSLDKVVDGTIAVKKDGTNRAVEVVIAGLTVRAIVSANGQVTSAEVPLQAVSALPEGQAPKRPEPRNAPESVASEPFEKKRLDAVIQGELWLPKKREGSVPVVLIIAGSGPTDRDGNGSVGLKTDTYRLLAEGLAARGIASLRFDKRGIGQSTSSVKDESQLTMQTFADDVIALTNVLRNDNRFSKLVLAGHSEGGVTALLAARSVPVDGLALLATPGRPFRVVLREQLVTKLDAASMKEADRILDALASGKDAGAVPPSLSALFRPSVQPFLRSQFQLDIADLVRKAKASSVVVVQGKHDAQISEADARALKAARPSAKLVLVDRASHTLKDEASKALPQKSYLDPSLPLSAGVVDAVADAVPR